MDANRLRSAFLTAPIGIALLDRNGAVAGVNPSLCALFGCLPDALLDVPLTELVHSSDADNVRELIDTARPRPRPTERLEIRCVRADGTLRWAELSVSHVEDGDADDWDVAQVQDVQDRHEADERLRRSEARSAELAIELRHRNEQLRDTNRRLHRFAALASHDLSAPLATIGGMLAQLQRHGGERLEPEDRELLAAGRERAERMRGLVRDMLAYARGAATRPPHEAVDLGTVAAEAIAALGEDVALRDTRVRIVALPTVRGDREQLLRVMHNLLGNAVKFVLPDVQPDISIDVTRRAGHWEIGVSDNGPGVDEADRQRIFLPLERAHPQTVPGSGLGLAICAEVLALHGGEIWVKPARGGGSRFAFTLPDEPPSTRPARPDGT